MTKDKTILIRNVYCMLCYAFQVPWKAKEKEVGSEEFKTIQNLFAKLLSEDISFLLKQGLHREYISHQEDLFTMRGKINMPSTIRNKVARNEALSCEFDELSENNILNQILKTSALLLIKYREEKAQAKGVEKQFKDALKKEMLLFSNVDEIDPSTIRWSSLRFQRNNQNYQKPIKRCEFFLKGLLQTTEEGKHKLLDVLDDQDLHHLYEKFILEYYAWHYRGTGLSVDPSQIPWALDDGFKDMLPGMQSDIHLQKGNNVLIIDAKYYGKSVQVHFDKESYRSNNLYQIFTYVKNEDYKFGSKEHKVSGMLLYAKTDEENQPDRIYQMHGNQISVRTLDLNVPFEEIERQLQGIVYDHFGLRPKRA